ncbi:MAG: DUF885 domain-containing protein [Candidatus Latescibacteria bacterium]|nr:DUF885 domain-containing protein [Candidatus Latescibacterota bacterium]
MIRRSMLLPALLAFAVAFAQPDAAAGAAGAAATSQHAAQAEQRFAKLVEEYTRGAFAFHPGWATSWGAHEYDSILGDRSRAGIDREIARLRKAIAETKRIDPALLSDSTRIDYDLFQRTAEGNLFDLTEIRRWENDPSSYDYSEAIFALVARSFAPPETRLRSVIARLRQVPRLFQSAKANLKNPPAMFTQFAAEDFEGSIEFLDREVPAAFASVTDPALRLEYESAKQTAAEATRDYVRWLREELLPRSNGSFILGSERYRKKLHYDEMVDLPLDSLLRVGARELKRLEARYEAAAMKIDPSVGPDELVERMRRDHPAADSVIPYVIGLLEDIRSYCISSGFITVPSEVRCTVRPTPSFSASRSFASLDSPGPLETKATEAYYNITLPDSSWDSTRVEQHLQGFSRWMLPTTSVHEAYPGHYVHFLYGKRAPSLVRKTMGCGSFAEGWGLYVEEALVDHGYRREDPRAEFGMLRWALVRACRLQVGIRVHTAGMTMDQAIEYFMEHAHMERANAEREAYRAAFDPTYLVYTLGALQIRKLRDDVARAEGPAFDLARFHARMLSQGSLPVALLRRILLHDSGPTL